VKSEDKPEKSKKKKKKRGKKRKKGPEEKAQEKSSFKDKNALITVIPFIGITYCFIALLTRKELKPEWLS